MHVPIDRSRLRTRIPGKTMSHSVRSHLRVEIEAYDRSIRAFIPAYEEMLERAAEAVAAAGPERVLDLGAGTGALAEAVLRRCGGCTIELIDTDAEMLDQARTRLASFAARVQYSERRFQGPLPACDAVVASLALHHVATLAEKARVFAAIFAALRPGGVFVNADATMSADPGTRRAEYEAWAAHLVSSGIEEKRAWRHFEEWSGEDTYLPVEDELAALRSAGFAAECLWRVVPITVVKAVKPGAGGG